MTKYVLCIVINMADSKVCTQKCLQISRTFASALDVSEALHVQGIYWNFSAALESGLMQLSGREWHHLCISSVINFYLKAIRFSLKDYRNACRCCSDYLRIILTSIQSSVSCLMKSVAIITSTCC